MLRQLFGEQHLLDDQLGGDRGIERRQSGTPGTMARSIRQALDGIGNPASTIIRISPWPMAAMARDSSWFEVPSVS